MARITVEDCLEQVPNRFTLCHVAAKRAKMLKNEEVQKLVPEKNKDIVTALREIAKGAVVIKQ